MLLYIILRPGVIVFSCHEDWVVRKSSHSRSLPYKSTIIKWSLKRYKKSMWGSWIYISAVISAWFPLLLHISIFTDHLSGVAGSPIESRYAKMWRLQWLSEPCWWLHLWHLQVLPGFKQTGRALQVNKLMSKMKCWSQRWKAHVKEQMSI